MTDIIIVNSFRSKALVIIPFILVILGKLISIREKMNTNKSFTKDVAMNIGLIIALALFLIS